VKRKGKQIRTGKKEQKGGPIELDSKRESQRKKGAPYLRGIPKAPGLRALGKHWRCVREGEKKKKRGWRLIDEKGKEANQPEEEGGDHKKNHNCDSTSQKMKEDGMNKRKKHCLLQKKRRGEKGDLTRKRKQQEETFAGDDFAAKGKLEDEIGTRKKRIWQKRVGRAIHCRLNRRKPNQRTKGKTPQPKPKKAGWGNTRGETGLH